MEGNVGFWLLKLVGFLLVLYLAHSAWRFYCYRKRKFEAMLPADLLQKKKGAKKARRDKKPPFEEGVSVGFAVMAPFSQFFSGETIAQVVRDFGLLRTPEGYYQLPSPDGERVFCVMVNVHKPGAFAEDLQNMAEIEGVMLWQYLPQTANVLRDFDDFFAIVNDMARAMGGNLCNRRRKRLLSNEYQTLRSEIQKLQVRYLAHLGITP